MKNALSGLAIKRISTADQVASGIRERILLGEIEPGTPLREVELAAAIGVSRNTLREALRILIQVGLVRHKPHRGINVAELSAEAASEIYRIRRLLEVSAVETRRPSEEALARIEESVEDLERAAEGHDWRALVEADMRFHGLLVSLLGNERLNVFFGNLVTELRIGLQAVDRASSDLKSLSGQHRQFYELLAAGKRKQCARLLDAHLEEAEQTVHAVLSAGPVTA